ncbi:MAG TPA: hypothetical protein ENK74_06695 [Nitratifractor sp.]|nr:hypothetical protein [Nitratifractor sp.]
MKIKKALFATLLFVFLLFSIYYLHIQFFDVNVVFYAAILDGIIAVILMSLVLLLLPSFKLFTGFEKTLLITIWLLGSYIHAISIPTVLDRSLSFYILQKIKERGGGIKESGFKKVFTDEYVKEHRLIDVRLTEQLESGTITIDKKGCVKLTPWGEELATFSLWYRKNLLPKRRLLMGKYTDALTDPFKYGGVDIKGGFDYLCH